MRYDKVSLQAGNNVAGLLCYELLLFVVTTLVPNLIGAGLKPAPTDSE